MYFKISIKNKRQKSGIAEELEKISEEKKQRILTTELSKHRDKEPTVTPLAYAIFCENSQAVKDILQQAELSNLLKSVLSVKIISDDSLVYTPLTYAILCKNSKAIEEILKASKENDILKDILDTTTTIKHSDSREVTYTLLAYAILRENSIAIEEILKISKENSILKNILNATITIKYPNGRKITVTPLTYAILRKDSTAVEKMLRVAKENDILKDILNTTITIKHQNNQKVTDKLLAALHDHKVIQEILEIARENDILKDISNATITIKYQDSEEKIYTPLTYAISCQSNEVVNTTRAINQDGQEKTHIPFPTLDKRETELKLKEKRQSKRDEGLNFNNGSSDKNVEIKVNGDILL
jgi:hypothetical protein